MIIGIWAQIRVTSAFHKWGEVRASSNITGAECAREILQAAQIPDVEVVETNDFLGDHYDPRDKKLHLSSSVYNTPSVAALGIAAHETGLKSVPVHSYTFPAILSTPNGEAPAGFAVTICG